RGRIHQVNVSDGGVPKRPVEAADVTTTGLIGDRQNDTKHHGGPPRAVCLFSPEVIDRLRGEGHPSEPGSAGENVTLSGLEWADVAPGGRFVFDGGVELQVTSYTTPCSTIRNAFQDLRFNRIKQAEHPGESRVYACVVQPG